MSVSNELLSTERSKLIDTAVLFLQGPKVQTTPIELRKQFLRKKGLTDDEINIACDKAGVNTYTQLDTSGHNHVSLSVNHQIRQPMALTSSWVQKVKDIVYALGFVSGLAYAIYLFYKKFIKPWLFGTSSPKSIETAVEDIEKLAINSNKEVQKLHEELERITESQNSVKSSLSYQISELKSEITSLKGLLLNRKQFPATPAVSGPVSIPSWQLTNEDGNEEAGNGSNSGASDVEISNTNGSDSSLEMIRSCHENSTGNENN